MEANAAATRRGVAIGLVLALLAVMLWTINEEPAAAAPAAVAPAPFVAQLGDNADFPNGGSPGAWFAKYDGVDGESVDANHPKWIDILAIEWGMHRTDAGNLGRRRAPAEVEDFVLVFDYEKASPKLLEAVFDGKVFPKLEVELTTNFEEGRVAYLRYEMTNVLVKSYHVSGEADGTRPTVVVTHNFEEMKVTYTEYDASGSSLGNVVAEIKPKG